MLAEVHKKTQRIILTKFSPNIAKCKFELHTTVEKEENRVIKEIQAKIRAFPDNLNEPNLDEAKKAIKDYAKALYQEKKQAACLGVDFNYQHLDISSNLPNELKQEDLPENSVLYRFEQTIHYEITQHNRYRNKENLRQAIKVVVSLAKQHNLNIKIEDLNFNKKKAKLFPAYSDYGKGYNRMLSSLPYATYEKMMELECDKAGVYLIKVNPQNTSQKAIEQGWERHIGAARIIAQQI